MSDGSRPPILVEGLWKQLRRGQRADTLRDLIALAGRAVTGKARPQKEDQLFWALRDVSFEVKRGHVLGVIGPNGSGKSTLLKLLAGIMQPTRGRVRIEGRVGALIEIAAGFHGELTGRENIYLQGSVMGLPRREVARRFDRIVEFSGIGEFLDTPVKRYSSGMGARLGFSIASHLDPDVLLIDEVLSVGDLDFQRKALDRLQDLMKRDIPVVLVSHQLDRILALCDRAMLLAGGKVVYLGPAQACVAAYVEGAHLPAHHGPRDLAVRLERLVGAPDEPVHSGDTIRVRLLGEVDPSSPGSVDDMTVGVWLRDVRGEDILFGTHTDACGIALPRSGPFELEIRLQLNAGPGMYRLQPFVADLTIRESVQRAPSVLIHVRNDSGSFGRLDLKPEMRMIGQ